jgi:hypothetical protein
MEQMAPARLPKLPLYDRAMNVCRASRRTGCDAAGTVNECSSWEAQTAGKHGTGAPASELDPQPQPLTCTDAHTPGTAAKRLLPQKDAKRSDTCRPVPVLPSCCATNG